jgi:hypothetical protein
VRALSLALIVLATLSRDARGQRDTGGLRATATLVGTVRDSSGAPVASAEIVLRGGTMATRTDARGNFALPAVAPGAYQVWFRRLGFYSITYNWAARANERTDVTVQLALIPHTLDPVVVRAAEDKRLRGSSSLAGLVVDSAGVPVPEAEVQLIGADLAGVTRSNGAFRFDPLPAGTYAVRVRRLGYAPNIATVELLPHDDRTIVLRIRQLPIGLSPVIVTERSGYGRPQRAWDDLERRRRWNMIPALFFGPEDMRRLRTLPLDQALLYGGAATSSAEAEDGGQPTSMIPGATQASRPASSGVTSRGMVAGDACILINGKDFVQEPLRVFSANEIQMLEIYPSGTDPTGTVAEHMSGTCSALGLMHPTYFVLWLKSAK